MRVLSTVSSIVENFVTEVLPGLPDSDVKTFSFVGSSSSLYHQEKGHMIRHPRDKQGLTRRTKIYLSMLKRKLPAGSKIMPMPPGGGHSAALNTGNIIFFRVP